MGAKLAKIFFRKSTPENEISYYIKKYFQENKIFIKTKVFISMYPKWNTYNK